MQDNIRTKFNLPVQGEEAKSIINEELTDITRLERFKKWAKENMLEIAGVTIMAGSLITGTKN